VKDFENKPFALIGINADTDRRVLKAAVLAEKISWRSFLDGGPDGQIFKAWGIRSVPTNFVLDHKGVIRHTSLWGEPLAAAIRELLREREADRGKQSIAKTSGEKTDGANLAVPRQTDNVERQAAQLSAELLDAPPAKRASVLAKLRDRKGSENTQALAQAIAQLDGDSRKKAREALAERLSNMKASTLVGYLQEDDPELRRAAALAAAMKEDISFAGRLIDLLNDPEKTVERASYAALKALTRQDFGPAADASANQKAKAVSAWKTWWKKHEREQ